ncbi:MAG: hypothetical protein LBC61_02410 [Candidatus Peribacteria bacterium]|nr:hypothetical protein [Candidatus Peribacteria bacterium]
MLDESLLTKCNEDYYKDLGVYVIDENKQKLIDENKPKLNCEGALKLKTDNVFEN